MILRGTRPILSIAFKSASYVVTLNVRMLNLYCLQITLTGLGGQVKLWEATVRRQLALDGIAPHLCRNLTFNHEDRNEGKKVDL
jgi:hypothetical protein